VDVRENVKLLAGCLPRHPYHQRGSQFFLGNGGTTGTLGTGNVVISSGVLITS
jgi:hypothetical protein